MRILFSFIIAFLFTILAADISSAQMIEHSCHKDKHMGGAMDMANCSCSQEVRELQSASGPDIFAGAVHCKLHACRSSLVIKEFAFGSALSPEGYSGMVQNPSSCYPMPLAILGANRTGLPPPQLTSVPVYLRHCSFLI
ncbi:MAG: hypothetical protein GY799_05250 [Desulfobulbaceae bacterium]|nr:hypothetical protein [Desulfobulbaceae bacterium]